MSELKDPLRLDSQRAMLSVYDPLEANLGCKCAKSWAYSST